MFPLEDPIDLGEHFEDVEGEVKLSAAVVRELLGPYLTEERREKIADVIARRTYQVVPVMEGLHDLGNVAAVLRSAEALGFQEAHVIDTKPTHKMSKRITRGAEKWLDVVEWDSTRACVEALKERGYKICVTHLEAARPVEEIDFTRPTAVVLGSEMEGITDEMLALADERCIIPMSGFVQSFNISVAAALIFYEASRQRRQKFGEFGDLSAEEQGIMRAHWYMRSVPRGHLLVQELWRRAQT